MLTRLPQSPKAMVTERDCQMLQCSNFRIRLLVRFDGLESDAARLGDLANMQAVPHSSEPEEANMKWSGWTHKGELFGKRHLAASWI